MKNHTQASNRISGSVILEYTIVFPLVLLVIFALFYMGFVMHQRAVLDGAVGRGIITASRMISDPQYATITGGVTGQGDQLDFSSDSYNFTTEFDIQPYRYIMNFNSATGKNAVENQVMNIVKANSIWGNPSAVSIEYQYKNYVLYQEVQISAEQRYPLPGLFGLIGLDDEMVLESAAVQAVTDPDELIRNVDFSIEIIDTVLEKTGITDDGIRGEMQKVVKTISDFAKNIFGS